MNRRCDQWLGSKRYAWPLVLGEVSVALRNKMGVLSLPSHSSPWIHFSNVVRILFLGIIGPHNKWANPLTEIKRWERKLRIGQIGWWAYVVFCGNFCWFPPFRTPTQSCCALPFHIIRIVVNNNWRSTRDSKTRGLKNQYINKVKICSLYWFRTIAITRPVIKGSLCSWYSERNFEKEEVEGDNTLE